MTDARVPQHRDRTAALVEAALRRARHAREALHRSAIPNLPPARRGFAAMMAGRLERGEVFSEEVLRDLDTLADAIGGEAAAGTRPWFEADEGHARGGYVVALRDPRATALAEAEEALRRLGRAVAAALDAAEAERAAAILAG